MIKIMKGRSQIRQTRIAAKTRGVTFDAKSTKTGCRRKALNWGQQCLLNQNETIYKQNKLK
jgi:hypothetical protein